jgi:hypothetical protein
MKMSVMYSADYAFHHCQNQRKSRDYFAVLRKIFIFARASHQSSTFQQDCLIRFAQMFNLRLFIYQLIMAIFFNFNTPKPRQFHYRPLYYDERKERLEKMKAQAEAELAAERNQAGYAGLQKGFLGERCANSKMHKVPLEKKSALRFLIILIALLGFLYWFMPEIFYDFWVNKRH